MAHQKRSDRPRTVAVDDEERTLARQAARRDQFARLLPVWHELEGEEREIVIMLAARIRQGQQDYGTLNLAEDPRDFKRERAEEIQDLLVYTAFAELKATLAR